MNRFMTLLAVMLHANAALAFQADAVPTLEDKIRGEMLVFYYDDLDGYVPLHDRVLKPGDKNAVEDVAFAMREKPGDAAKEPVRDYIRLQQAIMLAGEFQDPRAIPILRRFAHSEVPALRFQAVRSISQIDAKGNKDILVAALGDKQYGIREVAAAGLSTTRDMSVWYELTVAASRERDGRPSGIMQRHADNLKASTGAPQ